MTPAPVIAICGIDGAGKSSLVRLLKGDRDFSGTAFIKKTEKGDFDRLVRLASPLGEMPEAYLSGPFSEAIRWAHAFDYLRFFDNEIVPLLCTGKPIIADRWSFCPITFGDVGTRLSAKLEAMLSCVPRPTLTIFLEVDEFTATERLNRRGPLEPDEHIALLRAYRLSYESYFSHYTGPLLRIRNQTIEVTYQTARSAILDVFRKTI